jgi:hypothetical protein
MAQAKYRLPLFVGRPWPDTNLYHYFRVSRNVDFPKFIRLICAVRQNSIEGAAQAKCLEPMLSPSKPNNSQ